MAEVSPFGKMALRPRWTRAVSFAAAAARNGKLIRQGLFNGNNRYVVDVGGLLRHRPGMLAIDLFATGGGKSHRVRLPRGGRLVGHLGGHVAGLCAALWFYLDGAMGREVANTKALEFLTGYLIEKSLAVDNVFVADAVQLLRDPLELQKRVLIYGVLGAIVLRTVMIFAGVWLISQFHWLLYVFGAFLLITGVKMWWFADAPSPTWPTTR